MGDTFEIIALPVGKIVHRVNTPFVSGSVVLCVYNSVHQWVAHVHVWRSHINLSPKDTVPVWKFTCLHFFENHQVFFNWPVAIWAFNAWASWSPALFADYIGRLFVNIGFSPFK
jgi:hypothetical protein